MYSLKEIAVTLSEQFSLRVPQLDIGKGKVHIVTGANGAGKSTLLNVLALLHKPQRGSLHFAGQAVGRKATQLQSLRRRITLVEQAPYLLQGTVYNNLAFVLKVRNIHKADWHQRCHDALAKVGLADFLKREVKELSGGEIQRVALARALVLQPEVLLLDEPTANIDSASVAGFEKLLVDLPANGMTIILSTHDITQAKRLNGEQIVIERGLVSRHA